MWSQMNTHTSLIDIEISHTRQCQCKVQRIHIGKSSFDLLIKRYRYTNSQRKKKKRKTDNFNEVFPQVGLIRRLAVKRALSVQRPLIVLRALTTYTESTDCIESTDYLYRGHWIFREHWLYREHWTMKKIWLLNITLFLHRRLTTAHTHSGNK